MQYNPTSSLLPEKAAPYCFSLEQELVRRAVSPRFSLKEELVGMIAWQSAAC